MQLRLTPRRNTNLFGRGLIIKTVLALIVFFLAIFLIDRIDFPVPTKLIKQEITNDKLITLK
tara:strand:- start:1669 stop:1854 length:186 start_codon:yes stop_codon:yes gene_type:complete